MKKYTLLLACLTYLTSFSSPCFAEQDFVIRDGSDVIKPEKKQPMFEAIHIRDNDKIIKTFFTEVPEGIGGDLASDCPKNPVCRIYIHSIPVKNHILLFGEIVTRSEKNKNRAPDHYAFSGEMSDGHISHIDIPNTSISITGMLIKCSGDECSKSSSDTSSRTIFHDNDGAPSPEVFSGPRRGSSKVRVPDPPGNED